MTDLWKILEKQFTVCAFELGNRYSFPVFLALSQEARNGCALMHRLFLSVASSETAPDSALKIINAM